MKQSGIALLLCVFCLTLFGCSTLPTSEPNGESSSVSASAASSESPSEASSSAPSEPSASAGSSAVSPEEPEAPGAGAVVPGSEFAPAAGEPVSQDKQGKTRITYSGNESSVRYVTSAADLPGYSGLEQYDDAYFEEHALLLVTESMTSGSVEVGIESVSVTDTVGTVTLYHGGPTIGKDNTDDMATWLLWAEVDAGLECRWTVANPALKSDRAVS